jgi:hypothetical protein
LPAASFSFSAAASLASMRARSASSLAPSSERRRLFLFLARRFEFALHAVEFLRGCCLLRLESGLLLLGFGLSAREQHGGGNATDDQETCNHTHRDLELLLALIALTRPRSELRAAFGRSPPAAARDVLLRLWPFRSPRGG